PFVSPCSLKLDKRHIRRTLANRNAEQRPDRSPQAHFIKARSDAPADRRRQHGAKESEACSQLSLKKRPAGGSVQQSGSSIDNRLSPPRSRNYSRAGQSDILP